MKPAVFTEHSLDPQVREPEQTGAEVGKRPSVGHSPGRVPDALV